MSAWRNLRFLFDENCQKNKRYRDDDCLNFEEGKYILLSRILVDKNTW